MMVEKEVGAYDHAAFPAMWTAFNGPNETLRYVRPNTATIYGFVFLTLTPETRYQNIVTERFLNKRPPPMCGGILADVL